MEYQNLKIGSIITGPYKGYWRVTEIKEPVETRPYSWNPSYIKVERLVVLERISDDDGNKVKKIVHEVDFDSYWYELTHEDLDLREKNYLERNSRLRSLLPGKQIRENRQESQEFVL